MTAIPSVTLTPRQAAEEGRPCGCAPPEATCCDLDCLVQPRFFCGQLLTDQDLGAMLEWTQGRLRLGRYRRGWGVVCGLDVRCDPDPDHPSRVLVTPGYAVGCCGDDVVVCEETPVELADACRRQEPYAGLQPRRAAEEGEEHPHRVVDLYLRYREEPSEPQTALGRSACREVAACEFARTRESFEVTWRPGVRGSDPIRAEAERWQEGYERCFEVLDACRGAFPGQELPEAPALRAWLLRWIAAHPLQRFCFVRDRVCELDDGSLVEQILDILFWLVLDCRTGALARRCPGCGEHPGVPLARVCLAPPVDPEGVCRVVSVDPYPPHRRPLAPFTRPAPPGCVNVEQVLWYRPVEAATVLAAQGVGVWGTRPFELPPQLSELRQKMAGQRWVEVGREVVLEVWEPGPGTCLEGPRVVGIVPAYQPGGELGWSVGIGSSGQTPSPQRPDPGPAPEEDRPADEEDPGSGDPVPTPEPPAPEAEA